MEQEKGLIIKKSLTVILATAFLFSTVLPTSVLAKDELLSTKASVGVQYKTHIQDIGWEATAKTNGSLSGTVGQSKRLEALIVELTGNVPANANIQAFVHVQNKGDLGPFTMGSKAGTEGLGLKMESIMLVLNNLPGYTIKYNVQVENKGWLRDEEDISTWFSGGEYAGSKGENLRLEGIRIQLVQYDEVWAAYQAALAAVDELDYTVASWAAYQDVVNDNEVTVDNSAAEIKAATAAIISAQKNLKKGKDFTAYKAALAAAVEAEYIPETWDVYQDVVNDNVMTQENSQVEINAATVNILEAQKKLQRKVDLTKYKAALEAVREADYTTDSWAYYKKVLAANAMSQNNTQTQVDTATTKILETQKKMVRKFDFTAYKALIEAAKEEKFTTISWGIYQQVVEANYIDTDYLGEDDTQTKVEEAIKAIEEAQKKLVKAGDLTAYEATKAAAVKESYTTKSWATYVKVLEATLVTKNNTQSEIDAATAKIMAAQLKLVPAGDITEYEEALEKVDQDDYTSASWTIYQKVVKANVVTAGSGQSAIDAATEKILIAQNKLEKKGDTTDYELLLAAKTEANYTSPSWATYMKVVKANKVTEDSGQIAIDAAYDKILAAQEKLEPVASAMLSIYNDTLNAYKDLEARYTSKSWAAYQKVVYANVMTKDNTADQIKAAVAKIEKAQREVLIERVSEARFKEYEAVFNAKKESDYTAATWKLYKPILVKNVLTRDSAKTEVDTAINTIEKAYFLLVKKGDESLYKTYEETATLYNGKAEYYQTAFWEAYQKALNTNVATREDTDEKIRAATKAIIAAQQVLITGAVDLDFYNQVLNAVVKEDYTKESWDIYWAVVLANKMTRDNTNKQVEAAIDNISKAQASLVSAGKLNNFLEAINLYQLDIQKSGEIHNNADANSWNIYKTKVLDYAKFDAQGKWDPVGDGIDDITSKSKQSDIDAATLAINTARKNIILAPDNQKAYDKYLEATQLPVEYSKDDYTTNSYGLYSAALENKENIITEPVKLEISEIEEKTGRVNYAKSTLVLKADTTRCDAQETLYNQEKPYMIFETGSTTTYNQAASKYMKGGWEAFRNLISDYYVLGPNKLDPDNSSQAQYNAAADKLEAASKLLIEVTKQTANELSQPSITTGGADLGTLSTGNATYGTTITWTSSDTAKLGNDGKWKAGSGDVILTATITHPFASAQTVKYKVTVDATHIDAIEKVVEP